MGNENVGAILKLQLIADQIIGREAVKVADVGGGGLYGPSNAISFIKIRIGILPHIYTYTHTRT